MITTIYKCDKCGKEQPNDAQFWHLTVVLTHTGYLPSCTARRDTQWCRECVERIGLLSPTELEAKGEKPPPPPTVEDLIREIVRDEIEANQ